MGLNAISSKIKSKLQTISGIGVVYDFPWVQFEAYPAATITPSGFSSNYETRTENQRVYKFIIRLFHSIDVITAKETEKERVQEAVRIIRGKMDTIVNEFDKDETLTGIELPTGETMLGSIPAPSDIVYFPEEKMVVGEITLEVKISFDTTS